MSHNIDPSFCEFGKDMVLQRKNKIAKGEKSICPPTVNSKRKQGRAFPGEQESSFKSPVMFCFPDTWWRWFWPPLLAAYEAINRFHHPFFAELEKGEVARREALAEHRGRGFQEAARQAVEQVTRQQLCKPASCSAPNWKKLGATWGDLGAGPAASRVPNWSPVRVPSHPRYGVMPSALWGRWPRSRAWDAWV